jgi:hypothetical protein
MDERLGFVGVVLSSVCVCISVLFFMHSFGLFP